MKRNLRTISLKLHNPTRRKREILDEAMLNYTKAYQFLLDKAWGQISYISSNYADKWGKYRTQHISKWITKELSEELNNYNIEPFKDSIKVDFSSTLTGYLNAKSKDARLKYPEAYVSNEKLNEEFNNIMDMCMNGDENYLKANDSFENLTDKLDRLRPIFFCRYSAKRDFCLLYDSTNNKFFAKIYLMNVKNEKRGRINPETSSNLIYVNKTKDIFKPSESRSRFVIFPLSFGKWQESYLQKALKRPEILKTARLVKRNSEYYLYINVEESIPYTIQTSNYMGIGRGLEHSISYSIVDREGKLLSNGSIDTDDNISKASLHVAANKIVNLAKQNNCKVIVEKLVKTGDSLTWTDKSGKDFVPKLSCSKYNELCELLNYKLPFSSLPSPLRASSTRIFLACSFCGSTSKSNRFSNNMLICTRCGKAMEIEKSGSLNLSRTLIKYKNDFIRIKVEDTHRGVKFSNKDLDLVFYPTNPYDCAAEFKGFLKLHIDNFYKNFDMERRKPNYKRKLSFIKKLQTSEDIFKILKIG